MLQKSCRSAASHKKENCIPYVSNFIKLFFHQYRNDQLFIFYQIFYHQQQHSMINQDQPRKQSLRSDLIIVRHAQSNFNQGYLSFKEVNQLDLTWYECIQIDEFNKQVAYSKEYIDCSITEEGKQQCQKAKEMLQNENVDIVLVSPHQRALETCRQIFGERKVKVEVHPLLAEVFRFSCDIGNHIGEKLKEFPDYDFSHMQDHSELWFIEVLSDHLKNTCNLHLEGKRDLTYKEKQEKMLELLQSKVVYESPQELRARTWKLKEVLDSYRKQYHRIAIVSHFELLESLLAKSYNEMGQTSQFQWIKNASPMFVSIDELLSVK